MFEEFEYVASDVAAFSRRPAEGAASDEGIAADACSTPAALTVEWPGFLAVVEGRPLGGDTVQGMAAGLWICGRLVRQDWPPIRAWLPRWPEPGLDYGS